MTTGLSVPSSKYLPGLGTMSPCWTSFLVFSALIIALVLRAEPLRRLRPLTLPLVLTAAAALAHLVAANLGADENLTRWTQVALVLALGFLVARGCLLLVFDWVLVRRMGVTPPRLMREVVALLAYLALAAVILSSMDVDVGGLVATSAVITVVVGLALQQTLGNLLAGSRAGVGATPEDRHLGRDGRRGRDHRTDRVAFAGGADAARRTDARPQLGCCRSAGHDPRFGRVPGGGAVRLGVAYGVPPDAVKEVFLRVATDIPGVLANPAPKILTHDFADSAVVYECRLWTMTPWCRDDLTDEFLTRAHAALARAGMEIPFPQRTLHRPRPQETATRSNAGRRHSTASEVFGEIPEEAISDAGGEFPAAADLPPREAVVRTGDESTALYLVASGEAVVEHKGREIARVEKGDFFGEMAFLTGDLRAADVRAPPLPSRSIEIDESSLRSAPRAPRRPRGPPRREDGRPAAPGRRAARRNRCAHLTGRSGGPVPQTSLEDRGPLRVRVQPRRREAEG